MKDLFAALCKAQAEFKPIKKDSKGYNYKYADINAVLEIVRPVLSKHGLAIVQMPIVKEGEYLLRTLITHASGEKICFSTPIMLELSKGMNKAQSFGSAVSYARRYALVSCLSLEMEDDDGQGAAPKTYTSKQQSSDLISEAQQKRMYAIGKNLPSEAVKSILKAHGFDSSKNVTRDKYDAVIDSIEKAKQ